MTIQFNQIPTGIKKPGVYAEFDSANAMAGLPANAQKVLLIGYEAPNGLALAAPNVPVQVSSVAQALSILGTSQLYFMVKAALAASPLADVWVLPIAEPTGGVLASATIAPPSKGPASSGTATLWIGGQPLRFSVTQNETPQAVMQSIAADKSAAAGLEVQLSAPDAQNNVAMASWNKGAHGNQIALRFDDGGTGLALTVPATLAGGTGVPDLTAALANIFPAKFDKIVCGFNDSDSLAALKTHLNNAASWSEQRGQIGVAGFTGTISDATVLAASLNSERMVLACLENTNSTPWAVGSAFAAEIASETDPARPLQTLPLVGIVPPLPADRYTRTEEETLLAGGCTPLEVGPGETVQIVRAVTTYTQNAAGSPDPAYLDLTTIMTLDYLRDAWRQRMRLRFSRNKLNDRTVESVRDETLALLRLLEDAEILEHVEDNKAQVLVQRNVTDVNRLDVQIPADVVNGLVVLAAQIDLIL
jgi:phage tail sheath gpL-like